MQLHERDLTLIEADLVLARSHCHSAVIVPGEHADIDLAAVHRLPVTLDDTITGLAFKQLAEAVVKATEERNATKPSTQRVEVHK